MRAIIILIIGVLFWGCNSVQKRGNKTVSVFADERIQVLVSEGSHGSGLYLTFIPSQYPISIGYEKPGAIAFLKEEMQKRRDVRIVDREWMDIDVRKEEFNISVECNKSKNLMTKREETSFIAAAYFEYFKLVVKLDGKRILMPSVWNTNKWAVAQVGTEADILQKR